MAASAYPLTCSDRLLSPCLLLYRSVVEHNLQEMLRIAGNDPTRLRPHVKTHKCAEIVRLEIERGIIKHKCATLNEARMLAEAGASDILIAYPQVGPNAWQLLELLKRFPGDTFSILVDCVETVAALDAIFSERSARDGQRVKTLLDIDTGMRRTGVRAESAVALAAAVARCQALQLAGLHIYDGQNHQSDLAARKSSVEQLMQPVWELVRELNRGDLAVQQLVCGGTPTFPMFATLQPPPELLASNDLFIELSPGTCVLQDCNYGQAYADMPGFQPAAVVLCRVVSKPGKDLLTVDLGYKAIAADSPAGRRAEFVELPGVEQVQHSEEHLVLRTDRAAEFSIGDTLLAIPAHVCPTVALYDQFQVIDEAGGLAASWEIARGRLTQCVQAAVANA